MLLGRLHPAARSERPTRLQDRLPGSAWFAVTQGESSLACLRDVQEFFGVGMLVPNRRYDDHREHLYRYVVRRRSDLLERMIPFFRRHPMPSVKQRNLEVRALRGARGRRSPLDR
jgi:hypothetical protein